jgi:nicotinate-nucleotide pyrophosphorylase (carboxylating)
MDSPHDLRLIVDLAISEDVGPGDWTTRWTVAEDRRAGARIIAKAAGTVAGIEPAGLAFHQVDPMLEIEVLTPDGKRVAPGDPLMRIDGAARSILTGERVALNFLQRLSGVATLTRAYVDQVAGTRTEILDTRKTTPGMRRLEKQAVLAGGGANHRFGLYDMVLIKENHIRAAGGITAAVRSVEEQNAEGLAVEVEVTTLDETREALAAGADRILFDNMPIARLREAVDLVRRSAPEVETEASGGVSLSTVRLIAETGVDFISVGALTHSAPALDLSLQLDAPSHG